MSQPLRFIPLAALAFTGLSTQAATSVYDSSVYLPPRGCTFAELSFPDNPPVSRPVLRTSSTSPTQAIVLYQPWQPAGTRQISYSYSFSGLDLRIPPYFAGIFLISSTRVIVYKGPYWDLPVASDRTTTQNPSSVSWASTTTEGPLAVGAKFYDDWSVRVISQGYQQATAGAPWKAAKIGWDCTMHINPAQPLVLTQ